MPWKETTMLEEKLEFINEWRAGNFNLSELCREFGISRPTAYKYIKRYQQEGIEGPFEKNRKPLSHPRKTPSHIEKAIVSHRKRHPCWGGEKIWKLLQKDFQEDDMPCISPVNQIIKRNGLVVIRKRRHGSSRSILFLIHKPVMKSGALILKKNSG